MRFFAVATFRGNVEEQPLPHLTAALGCLRSSLLPARRRMWFCHPAKVWSIHHIARETASPARMWSSHPARVGSIHHIGTGRAAAGTAKGGRTGQSGAFESGRYPNLLSFMIHGTRTA